MVATRPPTGYRMPANPPEPTHALSAKAIEDIIKACHAEHGELHGWGVTGRMDFTQELLQHRDEVLAMLDELPTPFLSANEGGGGGWTFLNLCQRRDGTQWTGFHLMMDAFVGIASALKLCRFVLPRFMWAHLPGSVPFIEFSKEGFTDQQILAPLEQSLDESSQGTAGTQEAGDSDVVTDRLPATPDRK